MNPHTLRPNPLYSKSLVGALKVPRKDSSLRTSGLATKLSGAADKLQIIVERIPIELPMEVVVNLTAVLEIRDLEDEAIIVLE